MVLNKDDIKKIIPHREPMLLVDSVIRMESLKSIETEFYVDPDFDIFRGHFPDEPVFPGVYSVECMAQACDIMLMTEEKYKGKSPLFLGINNVRFYKKIVPGDILVTKAKVDSIREDKAIIVCESEGFVNDELALCAQISIAMR